MSFKELGLVPELLRAIDELGHTIPTPIQSKSIPTVLHGNDVMGLAQTGTGKTAAFVLPLLQILHNNHDVTKIKRQVRALILTPTRELAAQVGESVREYGKFLTLRSEVIYGGVSIEPQIRKQERGTDVIVATPGRLLDLVEQRAVNLSKVEVLVLDEADRMLDMGFIKDVKAILALLPKKRQNMLFSATLSADIQGLADSLLNNHKLIEVAHRNVTTELVTQVVYPVDRVRKRELLSYLIGFNNWQQVLVFTRTKHHANKLAEQLIEDGLTAAAIHGNKSQGARTRALDEFKNGKIRVLVATDIAARGIDIEHLPFVVNFELPNIAEDYVHRIGRTGRAGKSGIAISLVCVDELQLLRDIERLTKKTIAQEIIPGYKPDQNIKAEPIKRGGGGRFDSSNRGSTPRSGNNDRRSAPRSSGDTRRSAPRSGGDARRSAPRSTDGNRSFTPRSNDEKRFTPRSSEGDRRFSSRSNDGNRSFTPRSNDGERRFTPRSSEGDRRFAPRSNDGERRFTPRSSEGDRRFAPRSTDGERRFTPRANEGDRRFAPRSNDGERRFTPRSSEGDRRFAPRPRSADGNRSFTPRSNDGERRFTPRSSEGDRRSAPTRSNNGERRFTPRSSEGDRRSAPARSNNGERRFTPRSSEGDRRSAPARSNNGERRFTPRSSEGDRRFTPRSHNGDRRSTPRSGGDDKRKDWQSA